ncbi:MAG: hypothetical protein M3R17_16905 [Bacteroidota bacterium]|nr:hypothetical protein [Bacteroidota bacterium]
MQPIRTLLLLSALLLLRCSPAVHSLHEKAAGKIPEDFILVRVSGTDCINCFVAYQDILATVRDEHLEASTVLLAGNLPPDQQDEFFKAILGDSSSDKTIINNDTLFRQLGSWPGSSVSIYRKNKRVYEVSFTEYNDAVFRQQLYSAFRLKNKQPVMLRGDSVGFLRKHYADEDYILFHNKIYSFSNQFGKIYSYELPSGKAIDSLRLVQLTAQLDYSECIARAVSDDTASISLTRQLLARKENYFTKNPGYPHFLLTNVSACDSFLCVSLYITYFMNTGEGDRSYGVNKRPILLLLDENFNIKSKFFFSLEKMGKYWTSDYDNLFYDAKNNYCWKRIFLDSAEVPVRYTLGRFEDSDDDGIFQLDTMLFEIPKLFHEKHFNYNFLNAGFLSTPDTLLYYYQMIPQVLSLPDDAVSNFPKVDMSRLSADYKNMKFVLPYRSLGLGLNTAHNSYVLSFETDDLKNHVYEWSSNPRLFREYSLPDGRIGKTFVIGQNIVSLRSDGNYRKIEYFKLPD